MAISKENVIFVYQKGNSDSLDVATDYANVHDLNTTFDVDAGDYEIRGQLVGVQCSSTEILDNETQFNTQVLTPLQDALASASIADVRSVWCIILGYKVPGGFRSESDTISSTSRIARINHAFSKKTNNILYNRADFQRFDATDAQTALITSRIDAPNVLLAKEYVKSASNMRIQYTTNGKFYLDAYSNQIGSQAELYEDMLEAFREFVLPTLNLETHTTTFLDPYIDVVIPYVNGDSYVWSWFTDRSSASFFQSSDKKRAFFYNADFDGALSMRDTSNRRWPYLAMNAGYTATAGAMSNPTIQGLLNPSPFFITLFRRGTIGEAYLFSLPFLDWTMTLFGDPLAIVAFPDVTFEETTDIGEDESWRLMSIDTAKAMAYLLKKESDTENVRQTIIDSTDIDLEIATLYPSNEWAILNNESSRKSQIQVLAEQLFSYPEHRFQYAGLSITYPTINTYLSDKNLKVSELLTELFDEKVSDSYIHPEGWWQAERVIQQETQFFSRYHFQLRVSNTDDFSTILYTIRSWENPLNWFYEKELNHFEVIPSGGIPSNYATRRVRYESETTEYLTRAFVYCFEIRQYDMVSQTLFSPRYFSDIIWT